jgi:hypothetical protein
MQETLYVGLRFGRMLQFLQPLFHLEGLFFGAGQAKLNALRFDDVLEPPKYIDVDNIERIAGEDIWEEFLTINIGSWSGLDLRRLSEKSGLKDTYDKYYSWTSGYVHGTCDFGTLIWPSSAV